MTPPNIYSLEWLETLNRATVGVQETGRVLGLTDKTVIDLIRAGDLHGGRLGRKWFVNRTDLIKRISAGG